jgi:hypothetical protein
MTSVGLAAVGFATCNGVRIVAYFPQIVRLVRDREGAKGISCQPGFEESRRPVFKLKAQTRPG